MDRYLTGVDVPEYDLKITKTIEKANVELMAGGHYVLGFRNLSGQIYRKIALEGFGDYVKASEIFKEIGFINEIKNPMSIVSGCDAIFIPQK